MATRTWVDQLKKPSAAQKDYGSKFPGLKLRVFASGRKVWFIRGRVSTAGEGKGTLKFVQLGEYPGMSEDGAKLAAAQARDSLRKGLDPNALRDAAIRAAEIQSKTFGEVVAEWTASRVSKWRENVIASRRILFNGEKLKPWHDRPIAGITVQEVESYADSIKPNSQQAAVGPVRSVFKFAAERGYIARSPFVEGGISVARSEGNPAPLIEFHEGRTPDFSELVATMDALDSCEAMMPLSPWWNIWRVCILTGQRPSAVIGLRWAELALEGEAPVWTLPVERSKIKREVKIPLSLDCAAILRNVTKGESDLVWPGRDGQSPLHYPEGEPKMVSGHLAARGFQKGWKPGRARDSLASWLEFQTDATERAMAVLLNHKPPADNTRRKHYAKIGAEHQARTLIERYAGAVRDARAGVRDKVIALSGRK